MNNMKSFFNLALGIEYKVKMKRQDKEENLEIWKNGVDFWGNRYIEDEKSNRLYFHQGRDFFACLDYNGSKTASLLLE